MFRHLKFALFFCLASGKAVAQGETPIQLTDVLSDCGCLLPDMPAELRGTTVANFIFNTDDEGFMVAFRSSFDDGTPLQVITGTSSSWKQAVFDVQRTGVDAEPQNIGGPLWDIHREGGMILVGMRVASAGIATSILTPGLERIGTIYGAVLAVLPDGLVVYQHGQIRFAPTHYTELAVLDTRTGTQKDIYPPSSPDKIRRERIERDSADYAAKGKDWCRENNHHCDPALFDNHLWSAGQGPSYIYDSSTAALAFSVIYGAHNDLIDVMVVCTGMQTIETIQCHETALEEWARTLGINSDDRLQLLKQAAIEPGRVMP